MIISLIVATDKQNGIGVNNQLLCHLPADLKYFKQTTSGHCIVMGRKTYDSIGRPLPNRTNIIITRNASLTIEGCVVVTSLQQAIEHAQAQGETELMITGGGSIYAEALPIADKIYLTRIAHTFNADTFFPVIDGNTFELVGEVKNMPDEKNAYAFTFETWQRK